MVIILARIINFFVQLITLLVIIKVFLSYFMSPYHPVRSYVDRFVDPLLRPVRRFIPPIGMIDLSPIILLIIVQILGRILISLLLSI